MTHLVQSSTIPRQCEGNTATPSMSPKRPVTAYGAVTQGQNMWKPGEAFPAQYVDAWVRDQPVEKPPFLIPLRIPFGCVLISAPPGCHKTGVVHTIANTIAYGLPIPAAEGWEPTENGLVLIIDPDESGYDWRERSLRLNPGGAFDWDGSPQKAERIFIFHAPKGATMATRIAWLRKTMQELEEGTGERIVMVAWDTLGSLLGEKENGQNSYEQGAAIQRLNQEFSNERRVLFLTNHLAKDGRMIGSVGGIVGNCNLAMQIKMTPESNEGVLTCDGEDLKMRGGAPWTLPLKIKSGVPELVDNIVQLAMHRDATPRQIIAYLAQNPGSTSTQICQALGATDRAAQGRIWNRLTDLKRKGEVTVAERRYTLVDLVNGAQPEPEPDPVVPSVVVMDEPEPVPDIEVGNPYVEGMMEARKASPLYAEAKLPPEVKAQIPWHRVCVGLGQNVYDRVGGKRPASSSDVLVLDRKAAFYQSCATWMVPNVLHREGDLDYHDVVTRSLAGMFEIIVPEWKMKAYPNPLGVRVRPGQAVLVARPMLDRLVEMVKLGFLPEEPSITFGLVGKGSERGPLYHWAAQCMQARKGLSGEELARVKEQQNQALGLLRVADPDKRPGPVDRADWQYAYLSHHFAQMNRYVYKALQKGEPIVAYGNTDEMVFEVPEKADPETWVPESMKPHLEKRRFAVKARVSFQEWLVANERGLGDGDW